MGFPKRVRAIKYSQNLSEHVLSSRINMKSILVPHTIRPYLIHAKKRQMECIHQVHLVGTLANFYLLIANSQFWFLISEQEKISKVLLNCCLHSWVWVSHHHTINDFTPLLKVFFQSVFCCLVVKTTNEQFSELFRLSILSLLQQQI